MYKRKWVDRRQPFCQHIQFNQILLDKTIHLAGGSNGLVMSDYFHLSWKDIETWLTGRLPAVVSPMFVLYENLNWLRDVHEDCRINDLQNPILYMSHTLFLWMITRPFIQCSNKHTQLLSATCYCLMYNTLSECAPILSPAEMSTFSCNLFTEWDVVDCQWIILLATQMQVYTCYPRIVDPLFYQHMLASPLRLSAQNPNAERIRLLSEHLPSPKVQYLVIEYSFTLTHPDLFFSFMVNWLPTLASVVNQPAHEQYLQHVVDQPMTIFSEDADFSSLDVE